MILIGMRESVPDIISFFSSHLSHYQFKDSRNIHVSVEYSNNGISAVQNGKLDISVLLPDQIATMPETVLSQCLAVIEIKTPKALAANTIRCINQSRLQLLALNSGGNLKCPFALLTNVTDYWRFTWLSSNNVMYSALFETWQQGLAALKSGLDMLNGRSNNNCPLSDRCGVNFSLCGDEADNNNDDVANLSEFYDDMTEMEIFQHKSKVAISNFFRLMSPSQKANFAI
jgi:hypothetical protein